MHTDAYLDNDLVEELEVLDPVIEVPKHSDTTKNASNIPAKH